MFWRKFRDKIESQKCKGKKKGLTFFVQFNGLESDSELLKQLFDTHAERTKRFAAININIDVRIKIKPKLCINSTAASIWKRKTWKRRRNWRKRFPGPWAKPFLCLLCLWFEISQTLNKLQILFGFTNERTCLSRVKPILIYMDRGGEEVVLFKTKEMIWAVQFFNWWNVTESHVHTLFGSFVLTCTS